MYFTFSIAILIFLYNSASSDINVEVLLFDIIDTCSPATNPDPTVAVNSTALLNVPASSSVAIIRPVRASVAPALKAKKVFTSPLKTKVGTALNGVGIVKEQLATVVAEAPP
jgi:hypothetical protein